MPAARVIQWKREVFRPLSDEIYPMFNLRKFPGLFSLLNTCRVSNESVHRHGGFVRIKSNYGRAYPTKTSQMYYAFVHYDYLRPNHDVFLLNYYNLIESHPISVSIDLQSFTHLVLHSNKAVHHRPLFVMGLEFIQTHCPNIKRISICVTSPYSFALDRPFNRFIDIDENLLKLKLWYSVRTRMSNPERNIYLYMRSIMDTAAEIMSDVDTFYKKMDTKSMAFWKNVQVVPVLDCGSRNPLDESELYIPAISAYACSDNDGNLQAIPWARSRSVLHCSEPS
ncbi:uncharacterized protein EAE98_012257 [Botrytis deweyae]|uniref:Uncharacterized protein n=1 Tax=Botrytis deweyae TaxID=2478750 RepID=A0ABQ7I3M4_9HELO|nr:uncharacterized protein EAE98_012257 [Botrytis deweyae]KAF7909178.1 hypothetical protein EAE98_012257 [Botrytis deweyae]